MKEKLQKWKRWIEAINDDMVSSANSRKIYEETRQIVVANPTLADGSTVFFNCLVRWYVDSAVMGLRRQLKINDESISLAGLLKDISENPHLLSRAHFLSLDQRQEMQKYLSRTFDKHAGEGAEYLRSEAVEQDLQEFLKRATRCEAYADKLVAHRDKQPPKDIPTFKEFYDTVDFAECLLKKYYLLIKNASLTSVTPVIPENWKKVFRIPWLCS